jgi:hypothetical protein
MKTRPRHPRELQETYQLVFFGLYTDTPDGVVLEPTDASDRKPSPLTDSPAVAYVRNRHLKLLDIRDSFSGTGEELNALIERTFDENDLRILKQIGNERAWHVFNEYANTREGSRYQDLLDADGYYDRKAVQKTVRELIKLLIDEKLIEPVKASVTFARSKSYGDDKIKVKVPCDYCYDGALFTWLRLLLVCYVKTHNDDGRAKGGLDVLIVSHDCLGTVAGGKDMAI